MYMSKIERKHTCTSNGIFWKQVGVYRCMFKNPTITWDVKATLDEALGDGAGLQSIPRNLEPHDGIQDSDRL